jgi:YggT family protein
MTVIYSFFLAPILTILVWLMIISAVLTWLVAFNVVNPRNQFVGTIMQFTDAITRPLLAPFRRFVPPLGGVDVTPILLILTIFFVRDWLLPVAIRALPFG